MATNFRIDLDNIPGVMRNIDQRVINHGLKAAGYEAENYITKRISTGQDTATLPSGARVGLDPSKPGEYPKVVTGRLKRSIDNKFTSDSNKARFIIFSDVDYAPALEYGGRSFLRRGAKENLRDIGKAFIKGVS